MKKVNLVEIISYIGDYSAYSDGIPYYYMYDPKTGKVYEEEKLEYSQRKKYIRIPKVDIHKLRLKFIEELKCDEVNETLSTVNCDDPCEFNTFFHDLTEANAFYEYLGREVEKEWFDMLHEAIYSRAALWCEENHFPYEIVFASSLSNGKELAKMYGEKINRNRKKFIRKIKERKQVDLVNLFTMLKIIQISLNPVTTL